MLDNLITQHDRLQAALPLLTLFSFLVGVLVVQAEQWLAGRVRWLVNMLRRELHSAGMLTQANAVATMLLKACPVPYSSTVTLLQNSF